MMLSYSFIWSSPVVHGTLACCEDAAESGTNGGVARQRPWANGVQHVHQKLRYLATHMVASDIVEEADTQASPQQIMESSPLRAASDSVEEADTQASPQQIWSPHHSG
jgi:hypothetical protein